jgi:protein phosphatase
VKPVLERRQSLEKTGRDLIAAANEAGGRDNITVILFRLEEVSQGGGGGASHVAAHHEESGETTEYDTFEGEAVPAPRQGVSRPSARTRVRDEEAMQTGEVAHAVRAADEAEAAYRASGTVAMSAIKPRAETQDAPERTITLPDGTPPEGGRPVQRPRRRRRRRRVPLAVLIPLVLLVMVASAFWTASRAVYFVGADEDRGNVVTIYRGLPIDLPLGVKLYSRYAGSGVTLESVSPARRSTFTNHKLRSKDDAENLVIQLERGQLDS